MRYKELEDGRKSIYLDTYHNGKRHMSHIMAKFNADIRLDEVDKQFRIDFINYLRTVHSVGRRRAETCPLPQFIPMQVLFQMALNEAVRQGLIEENPWAKLIGLTNQRSRKANANTLTIDEVKKLTETPFFHEYVRQAFCSPAFVVSGCRPRTAALEIYLRRPGSVENRHRSAEDRRSAVFSPSKASCKVAA